MLNKIFSVNGVRIEASDETFEIKALGESLTGGAKPYFHLSIENVGEYEPTGMRAEIVTDDENLLSVLHTSDDGIVYLRTDFLKENNDMRISNTLGIKWPDTPERTYLKLDWLNALDLKDGTVRYPSLIVPKKDGRNAMQNHDTYTMPLTLMKNDGKGVAFCFEIPAAALTWDRLLNRQIKNVRTRADLDRLTLTPRVDAIPALVTDILVSSFVGGWRECWDGIRTRARKNMDFSQYKREDLSWVRSCVVNHFAFVYGKECFDFDKQRFDMKRLLDDGNEFGGYDTVVVWHQYPRLGLDERSQWDFFDQFPGGLEALAEGVAYAHEKGTRVLLPFKPWDHDPHDTDADTLEKLCRILKITNADGIFFDTMNSVPATFRKAVDAIRPGIVFMTEKFPQTRRDVEMLTSCWDQYWTDWEMPETPSFRYLFPEHGTSMTSRWHVGVQKDNMIKRAIFNGTGIVIWQDVFGAWLPFDKKQKATIKKWKKTYLSFRDCFEGSAYPLMPTLQTGIFMNRFEGNGRIVVSLYNDTPNVYEGVIADIGDYAVSTCVFGECDAKIENGRLVGKLKPEEVYLVELKEGND